MSNTTNTKSLFGKLRSALQPKQSDCCSIDFEDAEEEGRAHAGERVTSPEQPASRAEGCCGGAAATAASAPEGSGRGA